MNMGMILVSKGTIMLDMMARRMKAFNGKRPLEKAKPAI